MNDQIAVALVTIAIIIGSILLMYGSYKLLCRSLRYELERSEREEARERKENKH